MSSSQPNLGYVDDNVPTAVDASSERLRAIAYSMDTLIPGLYFWLGPIQVRLGGSMAEDSYPGTVHSPIGLAIVLPGYSIYSTYKGDYDPR